MWLWLSAIAKPHASPQTIAAKRHQWLAQGKDRLLAQRCRSAQRYVIDGATSPTVFWLLETDDPDAASLISGHFGDLWEITVARVTPQAIGP
ncbi:MAG: hypothetical protein HYY59_01030 [Candidatus Omnitrophica bacterium]|nr:hypothetical protein [Candidatus Omnitrophota bacterium]MBI3020572.1 hypothetical protein [Candidatus Omnitrophota bacterium]